MKNKSEFNNPENKCIREFYSKKCKCDSYKKGKCVMYSLKKNNSISL